METRDGVSWPGGNGAIAADRDGHWQVYEAPGAPIPTVHTILFQSADGALWVAGQDAEVLRLDYQTPRWTGYDGLIFQWESARGVQWFLDRNGRVVVHEGERWFSYGAEDGLIDAPTSPLGTRNGDIWVAGSHIHTAAAARFDGTKWTRTMLDDLSWGVDWRCLYEAEDGTVWFGAAAESAGTNTNYIYGLRAYRNGKWSQRTVRSFTMVPSGYGNNVAKYADPAVTPVGKYYGLGESRRDGKFWTVDAGLDYSTARKSGALSFAQSTEIGEIETLFTSREGELWVGSRRSGLFRYDGQDWQRYHAKEGLVANTIRSLTQTADGSIWAATDRGVSRFDGRDWTSEALPAALNLPRDAGSLKAAPSGALWLNRFSQDWTRRAWPRSAPYNATNSELATVCFQPSGAAPRTALTFTVSQVPQPGNLSLSWQGTDPWRSGADARLQYSHRMDRGPWSQFSSEQHHAFFSLPSGRHHFEVRSRDEDFNVDPHPAALDFVVLPPVWRQAWFLALLVGCGGIIAFQGARIVSRGRNLQRTNRALAAEIEERKRYQARVEQVQQQLVEASRQAGMAEVATNVLHNVGNALNSVNVSAEVMAQRVRKSRVSGLPKVAGLLAEHAHEPNFLSENDKGRQVPDYLKQLSSYLEEEQAETIRELSSLQQNINHIKAIVVKQQEYSHPETLKEPSSVTSLLEDALSLNEEALSRKAVRVVRDFREDTVIVVEKHKALQILAHLVRNAAEACKAAGQAAPEVALRVSRPDPERVRIDVSDNGLGVAAENLTRIFNQDYGERKTGLGHGLHGSANDARGMGGSLTARSDGPGRGAVFTLELPVDGTRAVGGGGSTR